ncbi:MAG: TonB-dependent receptor [Cellvibrio sp.]|uniref:TonB-dependent receptor n=1 Tax=Cellvibrio sp. TaxID=1965322 RepID=UPI0031AA38A5
MTHKKYLTRPVKTVLATTICALSAASAIAQTGELEEVVVTGKFQKSLLEAMDLKRNSTKVEDSISAKDLGSFPSENIAEAIQRIPGVQISNVNGRGSTISVRGLGPQYATTTLNGQSFNGADFTSGFRFDIIQTELASGIQVIKSPSADMDAGGLSGTINIDTAKPLSLDETQVMVSLKGQQAEYSPTSGITPKGNITYVDQFLDNTVGVLFSAGFQNLDDRVDNFWIDRWAQDAEGNNYVSRPRFRRIDRETERQMYSGTVQWQPTAELDMSLSGVYTSDDVYQDLNQQVFLFTSGSGRVVTPSNLNEKTGYYDTVTAKNFRLENNRQLEDRTLTSQAITADLKWTQDDWTVKGVVHHTGGKADESEEAIILGINIDEAVIDIGNRNNVLFSVSPVSADSSIDLATASLYEGDIPRNEYPNGAIRRMESTEDSIQLDVKRDVTMPFVTAISAGVKYRTQEFSREVFRRDRASIGEADPSVLPLMSETGILVSDFLGGEMSAPGMWIAPNTQAYRDALAAEGTVVPIMQAYQSSYDMDRDIFATYAKLDFETELGSVLMRGDMGLRYEDTSRTLTTYLTGDTHPNNEEIKVLIGSSETDFDYSNVLPSLNMVFELHEDVQMRVSLAEVLVHPIITSRTTLAPSETVSTSGDTKTYTINLGQPKLKPMTANQLDVGLEWYYDEGAGLTLNGFFKTVKNGTVAQTVCLDSYNGTALSGTDTACFDSAGNEYKITSTFNADTETDIKGYEVGWNQSLNNILPIEGFGFTANYTYVTADNGANGFRLADLSKRTINFTGYWENDTYSARVSLNNRSPYYQPDSTAGFFSSQGRTVDGRNQVDLTLGYNFNENLKFSLGAMNIFSENEEAYRDSSDVFQTLTVIGSSYFAGVTWKM